MAAKGNDYSRGTYQITPAPPKPQSNAHYGTPGDNCSNCATMQPGQADKKGAY